MTVGKTYAILGGGGSFGIHTAFYLLRHAAPKRVISIGGILCALSPFRSASNARRISSITLTISRTNSICCSICWTRLNPR